MSDPASDLYSFLRSKDFTDVNSDDNDADEARDSSPDGSATDDPSPPARPLRSLDDTASEGVPLPDASSSAASDAPSLSFDDDSVGEQLRKCPPAVLNQADFGIIQVTDEGVVEFFNRYESDLSGVDPSVAEGQDFFTQLAPCSNNRLFRGRFREGIRRGQLDECFQYTYTYKMRPTLVDVRLYRDSDSNNWIMVRKR